jgi:hypothetical protein
VVTYELVPLADSTERSRYLVCADDAEALAVARILRLRGQAQLWQGGRAVGQVAPVIPFFGEPGEGLGQLDSNSLERGPERSRPKLPQVLDSGRWLSRLRLPWLFPQAKKERRTGGVLPGA